jgi:hypothetical protein
MTNPFAKANADAPVAEKKAEAPASTATATAEPDLGFAPGANGDPFADPSGMSGEFITDFVDRLLLIKPTDIIKEKQTAKGLAENVAVVDMAVLDDPEEPGRVVNGVMLFQTALKREAKAVYEGPNPYLLGRLQKGKTAGGNDLYTFEEVTEADKNLARQFLQVSKL